MNHTTRNSGFTLIELLVVLAILVALTTVAIRSVTGLREQQSFNQSQQLANELEHAILGTPSLDPSEFAPGFLSDVGRLPAPGPDAERQLTELWKRPIGMAASHLATDAVDPGVTMAVGWRGPYLKLAPGSDRCFDGFGYSPVITSDTQYWGIQILGQDGQAGGASYDADVPLVLFDSSVGIDRIRADLQGTVSVNRLPFGMSNWTVQVFAYAPDPTTGGLVAIPEDPDTETPPLGQLPVIFHYSFTGTNALTPGLRVLRAYVAPTAAPDKRAAATLRSNAVTRVIRNGAQNIDLRID